MCLVCHPVQPDLIYFTEHLFDPDSEATASSIEGTELGGFVLGVWYIKGASLSRRGPFQFDLGHSRVGALAE